MKQWCWIGYGDCDVMAQSSKGKPSTSGAKGCDSAYHKGGSIKYSKISPDEKGNLPHHVPSPDERRNHQGFGVKHYLHHFYEDCAGIVNPDEPEEFEIENKPSKKCSILCRIGFSLAILFICLGVILLLVGFLVSTRDTKYVENGIVYISQENERFNEFLKYSRWIGAFSFCLGGLLLSVCIILLGLGTMSYQRELLEKRTFENRLQKGATMDRDPNYHGTDEFGNVIRPLKPSSVPGPIPVSLPRLTQVQPANGSWYPRSLYITFFTV